MEHDPAVVRDVLAQQHLQRSEPNAEEQAPEEARDRHAAAAFIAGVDVILALRVVELASLRLDEHVLVRTLSVVDAGLLDIEVDRRLRRDVLDEQHGQAFLRDLVHRSERDAVSMGERQVLVDPVAVRQGIGIELARREHDLPIAAVDHVPVVVDRDEVVVRADLLNLRERLQQRLGIPQPHVAERGLVRVDVRAGELRIARQLPFVDVLQGECLARGLDVVLDERRLADLLVRRDDKPLHRRRACRPGRDRRDVEAGGGHERPPRADDDLVQRQRRADQRDDHQRPQRRDPDGDVHVRDAVDDPA